NSSKDPAAFAAKAKQLASLTKFNIILLSESAVAIEKALEGIKERRPLIYAATSRNLEEFAKVAKKFNTPLAVLGDSLDEIAQLTPKIKAFGVSEMMIDTGKKSMLAKITDLANMRKLALKKAARPLGYPTIVFVDEQDPAKEALAAASYIMKYAGLVIKKNINSWAVLPILTARQDIYTDPHRPVQVEAKIYDVGAVTTKSPVLITTNFSITYYTVAGEVEASKIPAGIIVCDSEGMSVLTAWAAEKFTPESVAKTVQSFGVEKKFNHKTLVIPGYVAMMSGKLEDLLPGWNIVVGPREASGLSSFLKTLSIK
ncbi:MAG: acetyl-CoA decarbonylase/synthase complex subunit gamma, partial [Candidatus Omnitrophica bacterium]|nr:acetyl-CoA decarbonylase/synthase complex subunit gamma [Candidatus Omnitrophota bacterium]